MLITVENSSVEGIKPQVQLPLAQEGIIIPMFWGNFFFPPGR